MCEGTSCTHNDWDNVRVKCNKTHLRCRVCSFKWNVSLMSCEKCSKIVGRGGRTNMATT